MIIICGCSCRIFLQLIFRAQEEFKASLQDVHSVLDKLQEYFEGTTILNAALMKKMSPAPGTTAQIIITKREK